MKKIKNILLLLGIFLYLLDAFIIVFGQSLSVLPNPDVIHSYTKTYMLCSVIAAFIVIIIPTVLLILNLKNKYSKVFTIIVAALSAVSAIYILIDPYVRAIPEYLLLSKLFLIDTMWVYVFGFLVKRTALRVISFVILTAGSMLSIKFKKGD